MMPQFFLSYSSDNLTNALDLMAPDCFVTAHSFKHSSTQTETKLDLILTLQANTSLELGDKLGRINQIVESAKLAFPPNNVGSPLVLWTKLGSEALWTIWTVKHGLTAPLDLGVGDGTVYQLHLQLTILPHTIGTQYQISDLTVTSHQTVFVAHVTGTEPAATRLTLLNPPSNLGVLNIGVRGHRNLGPRDYDPFYPCSGLVSVTKDWQRLCTVTGHGGPFDNGLFEVFLDLVDGATSIPNITNLKSLLVPGSGLAGGSYEYLQTGADFFGFESAPSNIASIDLPSAPLVFNSPLSAQTGDLLSMGNQSGPTFGTTGVSFSVQSNGLVFQDTVVAPLLCPSDPSYGTIPPTNFLPPKPGELGFVQSLLRFPIPQPLSKQRTLTLTMTLTSLSLGTLGSPVFFPLFSNAGILFSGLGWQLYYSPNHADLSKAWTSHTLRSTSFLGLQLGSSHAFRLMADWTLGYLALNLFIDNTEVARLVDSVPPSSMDVVLGLCVTNQLPEFAFAKVINTDEASWSYTKVQISDTSKTTSTTLTTGSSSDAASSEGAGQSSAQSTAKANSLSHTTSDSTSNDESHNTSSQFSSGNNATRGDSDSNQSTENKVTLTLADFPIVGQDSKDDTINFFDQWFFVQPGRFAPGSVSFSQDSSDQVSASKSPTFSLSSPTTSTTNSSKGGDSSSSSSDGDSVSSSTSTTGGNGSSSSDSSSNGSSNTTGKSKTVSTSLTIAGPLTSDIPLSSVSREVSYTGQFITTTTSSSNSDSSSSSTNSSVSTSSTEQQDASTNKGSSSANSRADGHQNAASGGSNDSADASVSTSLTSSNTSDFSGSYETVREVKPSDAVLDPVFGWGIPSLRNLGHAFPPFDGANFSGEEDIAKELGWNNAPIPEGHVDNVDGSGQIVAHRDRVTAGPYTWWYGNIDNATFVLNTPFSKKEVNSGSANSNANSFNQSSATLGGSSSTSQGGGSSGSDSSNAASNDNSSGTSSQNSSSSSSSLSSNNSANTDLSDSLSTSMSIQDVYLVKPLIDTILPKQEVSTLVAAASVTVKDLAIYDGVFLGTFAVNLSWTPQPNLTSQYLYRRNSAPFSSNWQVRQLGALAASYLDIGDNEWMDKEPPASAPSSMPSLIKLSLNGIIDTKVIRSKVANGQAQRLAIGPVTLAPPLEEPESANTQWFFDVLIKSGGKQTGYSVSTTGALLLGHGQSQIQATGTSPNWQLETNRFGQSGGAASLDIVGDLKLAPGNNVLTLLGETLDHQPVSLEGASVALTIAPESDWLQSLE